MRQNYDFCLQGVLESEGGYSNDPGDPGGPTKYGITIYDVRDYVKKNATATDVKKLTLDQAKTIYQAKYWNAVDGDNLPSGVDYAVFDYGVNSGVSRANRVYNKFKSEPAVTCINSICDERMSFLRGLRTFNTFGKGWTSRVSRVRKDSVSLASKQSFAPVVTAVAGVGSVGAMSWFHDHWIMITCGLALLVGIGLDIAYHFYKKGQ